VHLAGMSDFVPARAARPDSGWAPPVPAVRRPHGTPAYELPVATEIRRHHEVVGEGFFPGEDVEVAVVLREVSARIDGRAHALVMESELSRGRLVILMGYTSGTTVISPVPE